MAEPDTSAWIALGKVVRVQGLRGEFRVNPYSGDPSVLEQLPAVSFDAVQLVKVRSARSHKRQAILKVAGIDSVEAAEKLIGREVFAQREAFPEAGEDEYYWADLAGCIVVEDGRELGPVIRIEDVGAHDNLAVRLENGREVLIPFVDEIVKEVDTDAKRIAVDLPEGLLDLDVPGPVDE